MTKAQRREAHKRQERRETVFACIVLVVFLLLVGRVGYWETHYNRDGVVVSVENQLVSVEDKIGMVWEFYGDGYRVGDKVVMLMDNAGTDSVVTDDMIDDVKVVSK